MWWVSRARIPCGSPLSKKHTTCTYTHLCSRQAHYPPPPPSQLPFMTLHLLLSGCRASCAIHISNPDWHAVKIHQHGLHLAQVPHCHHFGPPLLPPFFLQPAQPPTRAPLKPLEKTHLSQSVAEQDVSLGEKVSLWVSVHFSNGGCFFMRGCVSVREYLCVVRDVWGVCNNNGKKKKWRWYSMLTNHANVSSDLWNRSEMQAKWWGCKVSVFWRD